LETQARNASLYQQLKEEECLYKTEIIVLKWQKVMQEKNDLEKSIHNLLTTQEDHQAKASQLFVEKSHIQKILQEITNKQDAEQARYYQITNENASLEETNQQKQNEKKRLQEEKKQVQKDCEELNTRLMENALNLKNLVENSELFKAKLIHFQEDFHTKQK